MYRRAFVTTTRQSSRTHPTGRGPHPNGRGRCSIVGGDPSAFDLRQQRRQSRGAVPVPGRWSGILMRPRGYPSWTWRRDARVVPEARDTSDEELMRQLAAGRQEALGPLYTRYAARLFSLAGQSLDRATAEEIVQEVFLQVWRKSATFAPDRGTFRAWVFQIAHYRILNELRRRSRLPQLDEDPEGLRLAAVPDPMPGPDEVVASEAQRAEVREALAALPEAQRRAVEMAFVEGLTHEQVANNLQLPLGTTKTRIRTGLQRLRAGLAPAVAVLLVAAGMGAIVGIRNEQASRALDGRALALLTSSETVAVRLNAT